MILRFAQKFIDTDAIAANYQRVKKICAPAHVLAVVKCNAYGHGMTQVARALPQADGFAVATVTEALTLRQAGIGNKILAMQRWRDSDELCAAVKQNIDLTVYSPEQLTYLEQNSEIQLLRLWVKFDTGMNRLGFSVRDAHDVMQRLLRLNNLAHKPILMSHFACADESNATLNQKQLDLFEELRNEYALEASLANSAACFCLPQSHYQWTRVGIALYGVLPEVAVKHQKEFKPAMRLCAPLLMVRECRKGESIGYGAQYICPTDMRVGIVAIGYGDGYPRHAPDDTPVWVGGSRQKLLGRVSMDMLAISLSGIDVQVGDTVELWGLYIPVQEVATWCGSISYELLTAASNIPEANKLAR